MKIKDVPVLKQKVLEVLPIKQSELWKILNIDHRDVSELVGIMVKEHIIKKTKIANTFLIESSNGGKEEKKEKDLTPLISGSGKFTPCSGCAEECSPTDCKKLTEWVLDAEDNENKIKKKEQIEDEQIKSEGQMGDEQIKSKGQMGDEQIKSKGQMGDEQSEEQKDEKSKNKIKNTIEDNTINKKSVKHEITIKKIRKNNIEKGKKNLIKA